MQTMTKKTVVECHPKFFKNRWPDQCGVLDDAYGFPGCIQLQYLLLIILRMRFCQFCQFHRRHIQGFLRSRSVTGSQNVDDHLVFYQNCHLMDSKLSEGNSHWSQNPAETINSYYYKNSNNILHRSVLRPKIFWCFESESQQMRTLPFTLHFKGSESVNYTMFIKRIQKL